MITESIILERMKEVKRKHMVDTNLTMLNLHTKIGEAIDLRDEDMYAETVDKMLDINRSLIQRLLKEASHMYKEVIHELVNDRIDQQQYFALINVISQKINFDK